MASMILGSVGSSLLGPLGGFLGSAIGGMVDQMIFGGGEDANRIDDLKVTRADPGSPIPLIYGADRLPGIVIATTDLIETKNKDKFSLESLIGKGGAVTYTYHVDIDYMVSEGPVLGIGRIWADGNLVRGTRYELEVDTAQYPENIGGIPYPSYYRSHLYDPNEIPWTIDRASSPNPTVDDGNYYKANEAKSQMVKITSTEANSLLSTTNTVVYWKDTSSGYFIPVEQSHGYTGEAPLEFETDASILEFDELEASLVQTYEWGYPLGSSHGFNKRFIADLGDYYGEEGYAAPSGGTLNATLQITITQGSPPHTQGWPHDGHLEIDFYSGGTADEIIDGNVLGSKIGSAGVGGNYDESTLVQDNYNSRVYEWYLEGISIPQNTRYITIHIYSQVYNPIYATSTGEMTKLDVFFGIGSSSEFRDWPDYWNLYDALNDWSPKAVLVYDGPDDVVVYHGGEYQPQDPVMTTSLGMDVPAYTKRAHVVFDTLQLDEYSNRIPNFTFEVVQYDDVRISNVIEDIMTRAEVDSAYYDIDLGDADAENFVMGYSVANKMNFKAALSAALEAFNVEVAEIGNTLSFRSKYRAADYTIPRSALSAVEAGKHLGDPIKLAYQNPVDMPRRLTVRFKDPERNYQSNTVHHSRQQGVQVQDSGSELPVVMAPAKAKLYARSKLRDLYLERDTGRVDAPHEYVYVAPTDIILFDGSATNEASYTIKLKQTTRGDNGLLELEGVIWDTDLTLLAGVTENVLTDNSTWTHGGTVNNAIPHTEWVLLDLPPLLESHTDYGLYSAMSGVSDAWAGGVLYQSVDDGVNYNLATANPASAAIGIIEDPSYVLLSRPAEYIDQDSVVRVRFIRDDVSLSSITFEEMLDGQNAIAIGDEVLQYKNATKISAYIWELDTFLRGRRGTDIDSILSGHSSSELAVALNPYTVVDYDDGSHRINQSLKYKAGSPAMNLADMTAKSFTNTGKRITPLSPHFITGERDGSNNVTISWVRRDRLYQLQYDGADLQNSEALEQYEIDIVLTGSVVRTIVVDDATETVYSAANQTTDGITPGDYIEVNIYQMSATIGRGNVGAAIV